MKLRERILVIGFITLFIMSAIIVLNYGEDIKPNVNQSDINTLYRNVEETENLGGRHIRPKKLSVGDILLKSKGKLYLDGGSDTYITETAANTWRIYAGGVNTLIGNDTMSQSLMDFNISTGKHLDFEGGGDTYFFLHNAERQIYAVVDNTSIIAMHPTAGDAGTPRLYCLGETSSLTFLDRTPYPKTTLEAYQAVQSMGLNSEGTGVNHNALSPFIKSETILYKSRLNEKGEQLKDAEGNLLYELDKDGKPVIAKQEVERNLSATVSAQNEVIKDLIKRIEVLEKK